MGDMGDKSPKSNQKLAAQANNKNAAAQKKKAAATAAKQLPKTKK